jgi:YfiH family protein
LTVRVADCVPILLASDNGRVVAAVHAGWRGLVGGVIGKSLRAMHEAGGDEARPEQVVAAIGPAISGENFEVGEEVAAEFARMGLREAVVEAAVGAKAGKPHVDLQRAAYMQLAGAGVLRIDGNELCTYRDAGEFYSHRREHGRTGRMAAGIMSGVNLTA